MRQDRITRRICALPLYEVDQDVRNYDPDARIIPRTSRESFQARIIDMRRHGGRTLFGVHAIGHSRARYEGGSSWKLQKVGWSRGRSLGLWSASGEGGDRVIYPIVWKFVSSRAAGVCDLLTNHGMTRRSVSSRPFTKAKTTSSTLLSSVMGTTPNGEQCNLSSGHKRDFNFVCAFNKSFH